MSNETKVGILTVVALAILLWGYNFLKGKNILYPSTYAYVEYDHVDGLAKSAPIFLNGFQVGIVSDLYLKEDYSGKIVAVLDIDNSLQIPKTTVAKISSTSLMGGKAIVLEFDKPCKENCLEGGEYINGRVEGMIESMAGDYLEKAEGAMGKVDSLIKKMQAGGGDMDLKKTMEDVQVMMANMRALTSNLNKVMNASASNINSIMSNLNTFTESLNSNNAQIQGMINNANAFSSKLNRLDMQKTLTGVDGTVSTAKTTVEQLQGTLTKTNTAIDKLAVLLEKAGQSHSTIGKLLNEKELYDNLNKTLKDMDLLLVDLRLNPKRYTRILSRKQIEYELPENDPAHKGQK